MLYFMVTPLDYGLLCSTDDIYIVFVAFELLSKFLDVYSVSNFLKIFHFLL